MKLSFREGVDLRREAWWFHPQNQCGSAGPPALAHAVSQKEPMSVAASEDRKSTRLNSSHGYISYAVFCLKKKKKDKNAHSPEAPRRARAIARAAGHLPRRV